MTSRKTPASDPPFSTDEISPGATGRIYEIHELPAKVLIGYLVATTDSSPNEGSFPANRVIIFLQSTPPAYTALPSEFALRNPVELTKDTTTPPGYYKHVQKENVSWESLPKGESPFDASVSAWEIRREADGDGAPVLGFFQIFKRDDNRSMLWARKQTLSTPFDHEFVFNQVSGAAFDWFGDEKVDFANESETFLALATPSVDAREPSQASPLRGLEISPGATGRVYDLWNPEKSALIGHVIATAKAGKNPSEKYLDDRLYFFTNEYNLPNAFELRNPLDLTAEYRVPDGIQEWARNKTASWALLKKGETPFVFGLIWEISDANGVVGVFQPIASSGGSSMRWARKKDLAFSGFDHTHTFKATRHDWFDWFGQDEVWFANETESV